MAKNVQQNETHNAQQEDNKPEGVAENETQEAADTGFTWEEELPKTGGGQRESKYEWGSFPEPKDGKFPTKTFMGVKSPKVIYNSIKKFQSKLAEAKQPYPEFRVNAIKEGAGKDAKVTGVKVQRIK
ncbi:hypothetical protein IB276_22565 [Ensifer sp. ENS04]|uniref:hypothetical protein n=1 Tax=Ensifer sp. ENS04 TaxID=2769281 RepID=UPI00177E8CFB|nr:hypothetical protein [Ensifer sp. ENS04]MBD9542232.1 hypothetical protein [Ensifer sp. ENS04]